MALFGKGRPKVQRLARKGDVEGLVEAAGFQDLMPGSDGGAVDLGAPIREQAIEALGALGPEVGNGAIATALTDRSDRVRVAAVRVLYAREETAALAQAVGSPPASRGHARRLALEALAELRRPESARMLAAALVQAPGDDPVGDSEVALLLSLLEADDDGESRMGVIEELLGALADDREVVGDRAEELLVELAPASIEGVIAELKGGPAAHRAAFLLGRLKDARALEPLVEALEHRSPRVRAESAAALGELRDPAAVDPLMRATRDPDYTVRSQAGWALDRIGMVAVVVGVAALMRPMIHETVTAALGERQGATLGERQGAALHEGQGAARGERQGAAAALPEGAEPDELDSAAAEAAAEQRLMRLLEGLEDAPAGHDAPAT